MPATGRTLRSIFAVLGMILVTTPVAGTAADRRPYAAGLFMDPFPRTSASFQVEDFYEDPYPEERIVDVTISDDTGKKVAGTYELWGATCFLFGCSEYLIVRGSFCRTIALAIDSYEDEYGYPAYPTRLAIALEPLRSTTYDPFAPDLAPETLLPCPGEDGIATTGALDVEFGP